MSTPNIETITLSGDGEIPNNPRCDVIVYRQAIAPPAEDPASAFEKLFDAHGWQPAWRNGIFSHHHFHSTAHEALGVYSGHASVQLGGDSGPVLEIAAGDIVVLPAGVGHRKLNCDGNLGIAAAYPAGQSADMCEPDPGRYRDRCERIAAVDTSINDPVLGEAGPLRTLWNG